MAILGIDIGTTHLKAGLFAPDGRALKMAACPNVAERGWAGILSYDPERLWDRLLGLFAELHAWSRGQPNAGAEIQAVGIAGMAETGTLVNRQTGAPLTPLIPWFETCASSQAEYLKSKLDPQEWFARTGLRIGYKLSLAKLLWLKANFPELLERSLWLSAADFVGHRLTGRFATDPTLAERTGVFRIDNRSWDWETLLSLGLPADAFPPVLMSGAPIGETVPWLQPYGFKPGAPVAIAGHDHVCGAFAAGLTAGQPVGAAVFDSMGTAEALLGHFPEHPLGLPEYTSGFSMGFSAFPGQLYWQAGLSMSGGSLEWLRGILAEQKLSYADVETLLEKRGDSPSGILYFPYLAGIGSPHSNSAVRGAFVGLNAGHTRVDLLQAVLEGCAFELEWMRRKAQEVTRRPIERIIAAGGGTRNRRWLQIKADVYGCPVDALEQEETTLLGAALLAGLGAGKYSDVDTVRDSLASARKRTYLPDPDRSAIYQVLFTDGYQRIEPLIQQIKLPDAKGASGRNSP